MQPLWFWQLLKCAMFNNSSAVDKVLNSTIEFLLNPRPPSHWNQNVVVVVKCKCELAHN